MKRLLPLILILLLSCSKKETCKTCTSKLYGQDIGGPGINSKVNYEGKMLCGSEYEAEMKNNNDYYEIKIGNMTYRYTTLIYCK